MKLRELQQLAVRIAKPASAGSRYRYGTAARATRRALGLAVAAWTSGAGGRASTGFNELREVLEREASTPQAPPDDQADGYGIVQSTIQAGIEQLQSMSAMLDRDAFAQAVDALASAQRVLFVTGSDLALLGQYAVFRFAMIGRQAESPPDVITAHAVAAGLVAGDVCVAIGYSGTNMLTVRIAHAAATAGATVIAITSFARGPLADLGHIHLVVGVPDTPPAEHEPLRIRVAQMLIIDAIQSALASRGDRGAPSERMFTTLSNYVYRRARHEREREREPRGPE